MPENADRLQAQLAREADHVCLLAFDQVGARLGVLPLGKSFTQRMDASADAIPRLDDRHVGPMGLELSRRSQAGQTGTRYEDFHVKSITGRSAVGARALGWLGALGGARRSAGSGLGGLGGSETCR